MPRRAAGDGRARTGRGLLRRGRRARAEPRLDASSPRCEGSPATRTIQARARRVVERMALALQASLLVRFGDPAVADAFCASRLAATGATPSGRCRGPRLRAASSSGTRRRADEVESRRRARHVQAAPWLTDCPCSSSRGDDALDYRLPVRDRAAMRVEPGHLRPDQLSGSHLTQPSSSSKERWLPWVSNTSSSTAKRGCRASRRLARRRPSL